MAIITDSFIPIYINGNEVSKIGISARLGNVSLDDLYSSAYCGERDKLRVNNILGTEGDIGYLDGNQYFPYPSTTEPTGYTWTWKEGGSSSGYTDPNGLFGRIIWLHSHAGGFDDSITDQNINNYEIVTSWTINNFIYTLPSISNVYFDNSILPSSWNDNKSFPTMYYAPNFGSLDYHTHMGYPDDETANVPDIAPYVITKCADCWFIYPLKQDEFLHSFTAVEAIHSADPKFGVNSVLSFHRDYYLGTAVNSNYFNHDDWSLSNYPNNNDYPFEFTFGNAYSPLPRALVDAEQNYLMYWSSGGSSVDAHSGMSVSKFFVHKNDSLMFFAGAGVKFYGDKLYKPIISDGIVTGYSDDMTTPSDLDNWDGIAAHTIIDPVTPSGGESQDNEIDVTMSQFAPSVGFVNYIEMDYETAVKVASAFNTYNASIWNIGGDLFKNLISYKIFATYGTHSGTIKNISIAGHELEYNDSPISGNYIDDMGTVDLGSIDIGSKFRFNDWRDFAPYTKIECFVPCCGWCQLPPWVMGRTITGTMYIDIANGSCKAVIKAGKTPVAEIGGCCAVDVPFSSVATGAKAAGIITAITNGAVSAFNPTPQNLISGGFGILSSLNANYTETKGVMGDGSNINGCTQFLVKVTRPSSTDTTTGAINNSYKHEKGLPCAKTVTLSKGDGFTQITDANITGNMTAREKQMIIDGFRHGLIL